MGNIIQVDNLSVTAQTDDKRVNILNDVSFNVAKGSIFAITGESGSGKTTLAFSLTKLFPSLNDISIEGNILIDGIDVLSQSVERLRLIRRNHIRYIFQDPAQSFNPVKKLKRQVYDSLNIKKSLSVTEKEKLFDLFHKSGIENPEEVLESYPHQLSVGTLQRVLIVMAVYSAPKLIIADEPTSSVDASLRNQILDFLNEMRYEMNMTVLLITHDLAVAHQYADKIAVIYAGRLVEIAPKKEFFKNPLHPYSQLLLEYVIGKNEVRTSPSQKIVDETPSAGNNYGGCAFHRKCYKVQDDCITEEPPILRVGSERFVRCPYWK